MPCHANVVKSLMLATLMGLAVNNPLTAMPRSVRISTVPNGATIGVDITVKNLNDKSTSGGDFKETGAGSGTKPSDTAGNIVAQFQGNSAITAKLDPDDAETVIISPNAGWGEPQIDFHGKTSTDPVPTGVSFTTASITLPGLDETGYASLFPIASDAVGGSVSVGVGSLLITEPTTAGESITSVFDSIADQLEIDGVSVQNQTGALTLLSNQAFFIENDDAGLAFTEEFGTVTPEPPSSLLFLSVVVVGSLGYGYRYRRCRTK